MAKLKDNHVIVHFASNIPPDIQGEAMMAMEKHLRRLGFEAEVFKETMVDDSKLRAAMTEAQRAKL